MGVQNRVFAVYGARAQDASTVFTNPAGMTRLERSLFTLGAQILYADLVFSPSSETSPDLGTNDGGNPIGWFPGGGAFFSHSISPDLKVGAAVTGNFGLALEYSSEWVGRYYVQEGMLIGVSILPSIAYRVNEQLSLGASLNAMYGKLKQQVAINVPGVLQSRPDGQLGLDDGTWGWGFNLGAMVEFSPAARVGLTYNSQVKLDLSSPATFTGLSSDLEARLRSRGLLDATLDINMTVPQQAMASGFHQMSDRYALLWSVGWQQWSKFGRPEIGLFGAAGDTTLTANLGYKDTWHYALGAQYRMSEPWLLNLGVAYDTGFQTDGQISPMLPSNSQWRFGVGVQNEVSKTFDWGLAAEYAYGGTLDVNKPSAVGVALGGRGDLVGSYENAGVFFIAPNVNWKF
jgi:long-chain fatty acid transport protein